MDISHTLYTFVGQIFVHQDFIQKCRFGQIFGHFIQIFVRNRLDVMELAPAAPAVLSSDGILWFSYPRRTPNLETDIDSNSGWETLLNAGWRAVLEISIDETWSAIQFVLDPDT